MRYLQQDTLKKCPECQAEPDGKNGNFRLETRVSYREIGSRETGDYSTGLAVRQEVLVCLGCGHIVQELGYARS